MILDACSSQLGDWVMSSAATSSVACFVLLAAVMQCSVTQGSPRSSEASDDKFARSTSFDCPPWYLPTPSTLQDFSPRCYCADTLKNIVQCDNKNSSSYIALNYCMTYDNYTDMVLVGACPYAAIDPKYIDGAWIQLPPNVSEIDERLCTPLHREGLLCGECSDGYGISVHSTDLGCVKCSDHPHGWAWFVFTHILLQTAFFLVIFFFRISLTTAKLNGFLLACQIVSSTYVDRTLPQYLIAIGQAGVGELAKVVLVFYKFWVLDFFTTVLPRACFHKNIDMLQAVALQYVSAFYPFFLILCAFILVRLTDCNYKPISLVIAPCRKFHLKVSKYVDLRQSLIHTFSGVIVLSYSKLALVSYSLLFPIPLYNASGVIVNGSRWYHDAKIELFGPQHLPYGILAIAILMLFVIAPPLLLILYPFKWFRRLLHKMKLNYPGIDAFMDSFQGCYRDGTDKNSRDFRYFAALYFVLRLLFISTRLFTIYYLQIDIIVLIFVSATILFSFSRPYKKNMYNIVDVCFLCLLSAQFFLYSVFKSLTAFTRSSIGSQLPNVLAILIILLGLLPLVYFITLVVAQLVISVKAIKRVIKWSFDFVRGHLSRKVEEFPLSEWPQRLLENEGTESVRSYGNYTASY